MSQIFTNEIFPIGIIILFSQDKKELYGHISKFFKPTERKLLELTIQISTLDKIGNIIHTFEYKDCTLLDYVVFLDSDKDTFRWSDTEYKEIKELFVFQCQGQDLLV